MPPAALKDKPYLKLYMQRGGAHEIDRENARSIVNSIQAPTNHKALESLEKNPFFMKETKEEPMLKFKIHDLFNL